MIDSVKRYIKNNTLLIQCLLSSILLHFLLLYLFYKHPLMLYSKSIFSPSKPEATKVLSSEELSSEKQDKILQQVFQQLTIEPKNLKAPYDLAALPGASITSPKTENSLDFIAEGTELVTMEINDPTAVEVEISSNIFTHDGSQELLFSSEEALDNTELSLELTLPFSVAPAPDTINAPLLSYVDSVEQGSEPLYDDSQDRVYTPSLESEISSVQLPSSQKEVALIKAPSDMVRIPSNIGSWGSKDVDVEQDLQESSSLSTSELFIPYSQPSASSFDADQILEVVSIENWNDYFDTSVKISSPSEERGYVFSITLDPKQAISAESMTQNFYFLIDASSSIDKHKFSLFKRSVLKALSALQEGDRFNIVVLDKKLTRLSPKNLVFNLKSVHMAEDFLEKVSQASFISSQDLLQSLEKICDSIEDSPQMHTAILLTNGQTSEGFQSQQSHIKSYIEKNGDRLSLYAAATSSKNNLVTLDMLCNVSGGKLLYSDTNAAFPRKLTALVKSLKSPLAKEVKISAVASNPKSGLTLLTTKQTLPALYANEPYVIVGKMDRLSDIHLTLEARHEDEWITIEKEISFDSALLDSSLASQWNNAQVAVHYQSFLKEAKAKHLKGAREILELQHGKAAVE